MKNKGADQVLYAPTKDLVQASIGTARYAPNERRASSKKKHKFDEEALDLYAGYASFLVRTAVIRASDFDPLKAPQLKSPADVFEVVKHLQYADQEHLVTIAVDSANRLRAIHESSVGGTSQTATEIKHVLKVPLLVGASAVFVAHNHPSATRSFSPDDVSMTRRLAESVSCAGIQLLDHLLVTRSGWMSFYEEYGSLGG